MNGFHDPNMQKPAYGQGIQDLIQKLMMMMIMKKMMGGGMGQEQMSPTGMPGSRFPMSPQLPQVGGGAQQLMQGAQPMMQRRPF